MTANDDWTGREIRQQPDIWEQALAAIEQRRAALEDWLAPILARPDLRIILTGAGSSAYIGETLAPVLTARLGRPVAAISTTSLVGAPAGHLLRDRPTLLISYARSGNSPESLAAVELADRLVDDCYHLALCCNPQSALARGFDGDARKQLVPMPAAALDQSFAMTSSFTSMLISTLALFAPDAEQARRTIAAARALLDDTPAGPLVAEGFERVVFIGSGTLQGIATEAALKLLELGAGAVTATSESALGFRHGPKFAINAQTLVVILISTDAYSRGYDRDLAGELERDGIAREIVRLDRLPALAGAGIAPVWVGLVYLLWCQLLAYRHALALGINPDNPCPSGEVNRVVQGVTIYPFAAAGR